MSPLQLALRYMEIFCSGRDLDAMAGLFADDFRFKGPFFEFDSAREYVDSLKADPPEQCGFEIIQAFENESSACLVYAFRKPGVRTPMAQLFEIAGGRINRVLLVFDSAAVKTEK